MNNVKRFILNFVKKTMLWVFIILIVIGGVSLLSIFDKDKDKVRFGQVIEKSCVSVIKDNDRLAISIKRNGEVFSFRMKLNTPECKVILNRVGLQERIKVAYNEGFLTSAIYYLELENGEIIKGRYYRGHSIP